MFNKKLITLETFIRSMVAAVNYAQDSISMYRKQFLKAHMTKGKNGTIKPKMIKIDLGDNGLVEVPSYAFYETKDLNLEGVLIEGNAKFADFEINDCPKDGVCAGDGKEAKIWIKPTAQNCNNSFKIKMKFGATTDNETESLLLEELNKQIEVIPKPKD